MLRSSPRAFFSRASWTSLGNRSVIRISVNIAPLYTTLTLVRYDTIIVSYLSEVGAWAMKNGRALKGHKRIEIPIGETLVAQRPPLGGWQVKCACGWDGGIFQTSAPCHLAYRMHLDHVIDEGLFICKRCGATKPLREMRTDYRYICLACSSALGNEWQARHPMQSARHKRNHHLLTKFGITLGESERLLERQGGGCAVCGEPIHDVRGFSPHVDHDHASGQVRGILCFHCNAGLGQFNDDPMLLRRAAEYLERWRVSSERLVDPPTVGLANGVGSKNL